MNQLRNKIEVNKVALVVSAFISYAFMGIMDYPAFPVPFYKTEPPATREKAIEILVKEYPNKSLVEIEREYGEWINKLVDAHNHGYTEEYKLERGWKEGLSLFLLLSVILNVKPELMGKLYRLEEEEVKEDK